MRGLVEVRGRVPVRGLVATADVAALDAAPEVHPPRAHRQALDATVGRGRVLVVEVAEVRAHVRHTRR